MEESRSIGSLVFMVVVLFEVSFEFIVSIRFLELSRGFFWRKPIGNIRLDQGNVENFSVLKFFNLKRFEVSNFFFGIIFIPIRIEFNNRA